MSRLPPRRLHQLAVLGGAAGSGLVLLAADRPWARSRVTPAAGQPFEVTASGSQIVSGIVALALLGLAAAAVLLLVGGLSRPVAAVLLVGAGAGGLFLAGAAAGSDPADSLAPAVARATGAGLESAGAASATAWPYLALGGSGLVVVAGGLGLAATSRPGAQPRGTRRAAPAPAGRPVAPEDRSAAMDTWDALSRGEDPT